MLHSCPAKRGSLAARERLVWKGFLLASACGYINLGQRAAKGNGQATLALPRAHTNDLSSSFSRLERSGAQPTVLTLLGHAPSRQLGEAQAGKRRGEVDIQTQPSEAERLPSQIKGTTLAKPTLHQLNEKTPFSQHRVENLLAQLCVSFAFSFPWAKGSSLLARCPA